jgi:Uma2 family endonuclease
MNTHFRPEGLPLTTQAAEGLARRLWTVAEIDAMVAAGILLEDERFELIDGEAVPMPAKCVRHESYKAALIDFWIKRKKDSYRIIPETTFRMGISTFLEPDFLFYDSNVKVAGISSATSLLAVEVSDTTLAYDRGRKAHVYARYGVKALWVIDVATLETFIFAEPSPDGYRDMHVVRPQEILAPSFAPELALRLGELPEF